MSRWFRFYDDVLNDPKAQQLSDAAFRGWVNLMCLASKNDGMLEQPLENVAFSLRKSTAKTTELLKTLEAAGLLDVVENGWKPHNWDTRQFKSDVSTERVKRFRKRNETVSETPPDTEQRQSRTDTEKEDTCGAASRSPAVLGPEFIRLPTNRFETKGEEVVIYQPFVEEMQGLFPAIDVREQLRAMRAWLITHGEKRKTQKGMKRFVNGWLGRAQDKGNPRETSNRGRGPSAHDKLFAAGASIINDLYAEDRSGENRSDSADVVPFGRPLLSA